jgi:hypothetical protein
VVLKVLLEILVAELDGGAGEADKSGVVGPVEKAGGVAGEPAGAV